MLDWLATPLSGATDHVIAPWSSWHGRFMVLAWGVLLPLGAVAARYFKVLPGQRWPRELDNKAWWHAHRGSQWVGVLLMSVGLAIAWGQGSAATPVAMVHAAAGWVVAVLGWVQVAAGLARGSKGGPAADAMRGPQVMGGDPRAMRGDHYDMTPYRQWFERLHKTLGWLAVLLALGVISSGLWIADAPRWMPLLLLAWWLLLAALAWRWQAQGRCIDTYQAIWGPDPVHPGNRMRPIGWGVRRPLDHRADLGSVAADDGIHHGQPRTAKTRQALR